ncbi:MAG TPA: class I SAM-dependent methyltransferase [Candidatus Limnocylindria bacterium]|nr:class I SAM-dependent methyltransferase [Candidatus Limnocylindria bacterium]
MSLEFEAGFFRRLLEQAGVRPRNVLVVGCGAGVEVAHIAQVTGASVIGVDLDVDPRQQGSNARLARADARRLPFRDGVFDAVYCYHVLEHVPTPETAIAEARRVLAPGGIGYFGTPNKSRLVGYAGGRATFGQKIAWNLADYGKRLTGRWSNERGAHAGFTDSELQRLLARSFRRVESVSLPYYLGKYPKLEGLWKMSFKLGLARFLAPSVYFRTASESGEVRRSDR